MTSAEAAAAARPPLVMRFGAFGDMVLLTVLLRHLHERLGKPVDLISSGPWTAPVLEGNPSLGRLFLIRSRRVPYWMSLDQRRLIDWLRARGPGPTWYCDLRLGKDLLLRAGIPEEYIVDSRSYPWQPDENFADRYIRLGNETPAGLIGRLRPPCAAASRAAEIVVSPAARAEADEWLARRGLVGPYIVVHPGSRHVARRWLRSRVGTEKYWPEERWARVITALRQHQPEHAILLSGTRAEWAFNQDILARVHSANVHNVANQLRTRTLLAVLQRAHSIISVDTGPAHAAAALGCPTVALFGPANSTLFRPGGATTHAVALTGVIDGTQSILGITPDQVIASWLDLTSRGERVGHSVKSLTFD